MKSLNPLLLILVIVCALAVVTAQHRARKLFIQLESEHERAKKLDDEHRQLKVEQSTWGAPKRVADLATRQLGMNTPPPAATLTIQAPAANPALPIEAKRSRTAETAATLTAKTEVRP
jgi:cell division protein FtsL